MKQVRFLFRIVLLLGVIQLASCGGGGPVNQLVDVMDECAKQMEQLKSPQEIMNAQELVPASEIQSIIDENADYKLTDRDKEKLKEAFNNLYTKAMEKTFEFIPSEQLKNQAEKQLEMMKTAVELQIDSAQTLGELKGL